MTITEDGGYPVVPMTSEQRKAVASEYPLRRDRGGDFLALLGDHARV